jgi:hypothetical protein
LGANEYFYEKVEKDINTPSKRLDFFGLKGARVILLYGLDYSKISRPFSFLGNFFGNTRTNIACS